MLVTKRFVHSFAKMYILPSLSVAVDPIKPLYPTVVGWIEATDFEAIFFALWE